MPVQDRAVGFKTPLRSATATAALALVASTGLVAASAPASASTTTIRPTVAYAGATCAKTSYNKWTVTMRWTARNGRYTDLGSYDAPARTRVETTQTRTWIKKVSVGNIGGGTTAPTMTYGRYSHRIAPYAWNGRQSSVTVVNGPYVTAPVTCPA